MPAKQRLRINAYRKTTLQINKMPNTAPGLEQNRGNAARDEMPFATDSPQKRSSTALRMLQGVRKTIKSDYSPQTAIEGQLVSRLVSLLWRLRRAVMIEN